MIIGIISGYFSFLHFGHIQYIQGAKEKCDHLIVIINNDNQMDLKGSKKIIDEQHRCNIIKNIKGVDDVFLSIDTDRSVCKSLLCVATSFKDHKIRFFNSGDRRNNNIESAEMILCKKLGIEYIFIDLPKIYSSSEILNH